MNYEQEFELEAMLCPITRDEHVAAVTAIIADRGKRLITERDEVSNFANDRVRFLALLGIQAEMDKLAAVIAVINARRAEETTVPRRGRPKGSKTKPKVKPEEVVVDTTQHSEEFCRKCGMGGDRCICEEVLQQ